MSPSRRILLIHDVLPHFDRSGSDLRILQVVRRLCALGHSVTYVARDGVNQDRYQRPLEDLGVTVYANDLQRLGAFGVDAPPAWNLEAVLAARDFDVAILFHWFWSGISVTEHYLDEIRRCSSGTRVVVLTDDRHGLRELRGAERTGRCSDHERALDFMARERECYARGDVVAGITREDVQGLRELAGEVPVERLPMTAEVFDGQPGFDARRGFVFLGNFENLANRDALAWFCAEAWPRIRRRLPGAELGLAGHAVPNAFSAHQGITVLGHVADVAAALGTRRVFVSPIRFGTGIETKNLLALGHGLPLVTTTIGAEGMNVVDGETAFVADDAERFAARAVELHEERAVWERLATNGVRHVRDEFSVERLDAHLDQLLERAASVPPKRHDPRHRFSIREVEEADPRVLTASPPAGRPALRVGAYAGLGELLMARGRHDDALAQFRHVFAHVHGDLPPSPVFLRVFRKMETCYGAIGDRSGAERCGREAARHLPRPGPLLAPRRRRVEPPLPISVVLPTYDRRETLRRCLDALAGQTLPADQFEVVVVDDGSSDGTGELLASAETPYRLVRITQSNRGAGAARRAGVEIARGGYLLLMNDDTIAAPRLLEEHLRAHRELDDACVAVLGGFDYEPAARQRALTAFLGASPFLFPQRGMRADAYHGPAAFVTCNLSVQRDAVLACGSFDPLFRVGEDTDLGLRMAAQGCEVVHHPAAQAWHDHLDFHVRDLVRRARAYGPAWLRLLEKHRDLQLAHLGVELSGRLSARDVARVQEVLEPRRAETERLVEALEQEDRRECDALGAEGPRGREAASAAMRAFAAAVPQIHWFHVLDGLVGAWQEAHRRRSAPPRAPPAIVTGGARRAVGVDSCATAGSVSARAGA